MAGSLYTYLLMSLFVIGWFVAGSEESEGQLSIINSYPELGNFSYVTLTCLDGSFPAKNAEFRLNGTSIAEIIDVTEAGEGKITFVLKQDKEGLFSCVLHERESNSKALAAEPQVGETTDIYVELPLTNATEEIDLQCGIQPGALIQRYSVEWKAISNQTRFIRLSVNTFHLFLNVTEKMIGMSYQCDVKVNHDDHFEYTYHGGIFNLLNGSAADSKESTNPALIVATSFGAAIVVGLGLVVITVILYTWFCKKSKEKYSSKDGTEYYVSSHYSCGVSSKSSDYGHVCLKQVRSKERHKDIYTTGKTPSSIMALHNYPTELDAIKCNLVSSSAGAATDIATTVPLYEDVRNVIKDRAPLAHTTSELHISNPQEKDSTHVYAVPTGCKSDSIRQSSPRPSLFSWQPVTPSHSNTSSHCNPNDQCVGNAHSDQETECSNPHCQCQDLRIQQLLPSIEGGTSRNTDDIRYSYDTWFPTFMTLICVLKQCTQSGVTHTDESNGFKLQVPVEAIPEEMSLTIDVGVSLCGPFQYPEGVRRISPVFWVCVRGYENFHFLKPVEITMQHCLSVNNATDLEPLGIEFLKAGHSSNEEGKHEFQHFDCSVDFKTTPSHPTLYTDHFCFLCLTSNLSSNATDRIQYCLSPFYPQPVVPNVNDAIYFYVSFFLATCLTTVDQQSRKDGYRSTNRQCFTFNRSSKTKYIKINYAEPSNWILSLQCNAEIYAEDIYFQDKDPKQLEAAEKCGMYPPKFTVGILPSDTARSTKAGFTFSGAQRNMGMEVPLQIHGRSMNSLQPTTSIATSPFEIPVPTSRTHTQSLALSTFMEYVASRIRSKWRRFGIMLDISADVLDSIPALDCLHSFELVFDVWMAKGSPEVSWETVISVLESDVVDEKRIAREMKATFLPSLLSQAELTEGMQQQRCSNSTGSNSSRQQYCTTMDSGYVGSLV